MHACLRNASVKFVYQGHWVKIKVTGAQKCACVSCLRVVCRRLKNGLVLMFLVEIWASCQAADSLFSSRI